ncbi:MAG: hypothetical protein OJF50_000642 [Nitrospira sp.]|jgi:hypothetical protein|nr:hypothetical protein [Nitrospira sp.]
MSGLHIAYGSLMRLSLWRISKIYVSYHMTVLLRHHTGRLAAHAIQRLR